MRSLRYSGTRIAPGRTQSAPTVPTGTSGTRKSDGASKPLLGNVPYRRLATSIRRPSKKKAKNKGRCKNCLNKLWTLLFLISAAAAAYFYIDVCYMKFNSGGEYGYELPGTENSVKATKSFYYCCWIIFGASLIGFIIIHFKFIEIYVGIIYMFILTLAMYFGFSSLSHALYSKQNDDFTAVWKYTRSFYNNSIPHKLPVFIEKYQQKHKCCGWGEKFTTVWSEQYMNTKFFPVNDIPDSCCVHVSSGCGKSIMNDKPSGYVGPLVLLPPEGEPEFCDDQLRNRNKSVKVRNQNFKSTVPDQYLRELDLQYYLNSNFTEPKVCIITNHGPFDRMAYFSWGAGELRSLSGVIFTSPCDEKVKSGKGCHEVAAGDNFKDKTCKMVAQLVMPAAVLSGLCLLMSLMFMYYFSKLNKEKIKSLAHPREFTDYDIEARIKKGDHDSDEDGVADAEVFNALNLELQRLDMERQKAVAMEKLQKDKYERMKARHLEKRKQEKEKAKAERKSKSDHQQKDKKK